MKKTGDEERTILTKKANVDLNSCPKWARSEGREETHEGHHEQARKQKGLPCKSRMLTCPGCGEGIETATMQLLCLQGFRDIHCVRCKFHGRSKDLTCTCGCHWHLCDIHRQDPATHRSRRAPTREKDEKQEEAELKDSNRKTPEAATRSNKAPTKATVVAAKKVFVHQGSQNLMRQPIQLLWETSETERRSKMEELSA